MNRRGSCLVCDSQHLRAITEDLMKRVPYRTIGARYGIAHAVVDRHVRKHVTRAVKLLMAAERESLAVQTVADADAVVRPVLSQLRELHIRTLSILERAEVEKDRLVALGAIREARKNLELLGRLTGELGPSVPGEASGGPLQVTIIYQDARQMAAGEGTPIAGVSSPVVNLLAAPEDTGKADGGGRP
jgi:hypothetical protein